MLIRKLACQLNAERGARFNVSPAQIHYIMIANKSFEYVADFKYFVTMATNRNLILEEIKSRLNWGHVC
jgi:hypothetical protein